MACTPSVLYNYIPVDHVVQDGIKTDIDESELKCETSNSLFLNEETGFTLY